MKYKIFSNFHFTKGRNRTLVFDSHKSEINFLPNELYDYLYKNDFLIDVCKLHTTDLNFLTKLEMIFPCEEGLETNFPMLEQQIKMPYIVSILVVELNLLNISNFHKLLGSDQSNFYTYGQCNFVLSNETEEESFVQLTALIEKIEMDCIEFTILESFDKFELLFESLQHLNRIIIFHNLSNDILDAPNQNNRNRMFSTSDVRSSKICNDFITFAISDKWNPYFYSKVYIGRASDVRNSNNSELIYGYLSELESLNLLSLLSSTEFSYYQNSIKDDTLICQDCEFRRLCNDNLTPIKLRSGKWKRAKECEYNPFLSKWYDEDGYANLDSVGVSIIDDEVTVNQEILNLKFNSLWMN